MDPPTWGDVYPVRIGGCDDVVLYEVPAQIHEAMIEMIRAARPFTPQPTRGGSDPDKTCECSTCECLRAKMRLAEFGDMPREQ